MKKRIISFLCAALLILSVASGTAAVEARASTVISGYGISLTADGGGQMTFTFRVYAPQIVEKIGAQKVEIQHLVDGKWESYKTFTATEIPTFYDYDVPLSEHAKSFDGEIGETYKAVLTAYSKGYDGTTATRSSDSQSRKCI